jgi:redox-sensitive bicupin YhaK (pirin superfamily)
MTTQNPLLENILIPRTHDLGSFEVRRALPSKERRMVGPFIFWDQMGPGEFLAGKGVDVRPHPHIGLARLTYLFDGELVHRDSLGVLQIIHEGDINLMTAGKGIVHSERSDPETRKNPSRLYGIQSWLALPKTHEEQNPEFLHLDKKDLPHVVEAHRDIRVIAGSWEGLQSPMKVPHETLYMDVKLGSGQKIQIPRCEERALYSLKGKLRVGGVDYDPMQILVLASHELITVEAVGDTHFMIFGGAVMDAPRHIWWNFVSSSKERIEEAKNDWKQGRFSQVVGETEFIPLPE